MNVLVLLPKPHVVEFACFVNGRQVLAHSVEEAPGDDAWNRTLKIVRESCAAATNDTPVDAIGLHMPYGGQVIQGPTVVTTSLVELLRQLCPQAPLHLPQTLSWIQACGIVFPGIAVMLLAETAFFHRLPERECGYGLDIELMHKLGVRRYGFHGLHHEAACRQMLCGQRGDHVPTALHIMSICMEPRPEAAAIIGVQPVMVTGGLTPLEGLTGQTTCGEIDPSIVLTLGKDLGWGPERINELLSRRSGLLGLIGRPTSWDELFTSDDPIIQPARHLVQYQMLQACGAGTAVMGGLDVIVFSGRFAAVGCHLGPWLHERLRFKRPPQLEWRICDMPLRQILFEQTVVALLNQRHEPASAFESCPAH